VGLCLYKCTRLQLNMASLMECNRYINVNCCTFLQECRDECGSGRQLGVEGKCEPCPRGTYRTMGVHAACQACPTGRTTHRPGAATVEECTLPVCQPGTFLNGTQNSCISCKKGTYQPDPQQTTCIACPPNTSTKGAAAVCHISLLVKYS